MTEIYQNIDIDSNKTNFLYSVLMLPEEKKSALRTVYSFCRKTDDIVDDNKFSKEVKYENLLNWKNELQNAFNGGSKIDLLNNLNVVVEKFKIPYEPFFDLIKGMELDLKKNRYLNFDELLQYCYYVASTVGLICIEILKYKFEETKEYAKNLGIALQLTNILRDIKKDISDERIYIPVEDLIRFNYTEQDLIQNKFNDSFIALMKFQVSRNKTYYEKAEKFLNNEDKKRLYMAMIIQKTYFKILGKIEKINYNIFNKKVKVSKLRRIFIAFSLYLRYGLLH